MIIDSHQHLMLPTTMQLEKMDAAGVDKAILFCTAPHPEKAGNLNELATEMTALNRILAGSNSKEENTERLKRNMEELTKAIRTYPERFLGFGAVPLGMTLAETKSWIDTWIIAKGLRGIGEFTPCNEADIRKMDTVFQALMNTRIYPVWVHTFHPVTMGGIRLLMSLCENYPDIPVIFGHLGGTNWMEVIKFTKEHSNVYLDLSAVFSSLAGKMALLELPQRCLYGSDAPYGEPYLSRRLIEFVSPNRETAKMALGENIARLLGLSLSL